MLEELLKILQQGGTFEPDKLAVRLHTTPAAVRAMLEHLERLGRLQPVSSSCHLGCEGCPIGSRCGSQQARPRLWSLPGR